jgi:glycosyltransferase involved in cell wall biosynthesis
MPSTPATPEMKVALLVNMIAPARLPVYSGLASRFDLLVLHGGNESNRDSWQDTEKSLPGAQVLKAWGWQISIPRRENGRAFDRRYIHITPGFLWHLLRFKPDVVVSNEMGFRTLTALLYGTLFRKPVFVWWGGTIHTERGIGSVKRLLRSLISRWARRWISYGQSSTEYLQTLNIPRERILQIQNAVDEQRFTAATEPAFPLDTNPVLLYVGQLIARKGVELLLSAAAALQREGLVFSLLIVGNGREKAALEKRAADLHLRNVHFHAALPPEKMPAVYRSADVLVFPTLEDPWGLVVNEAILCGVTVLCSKYAGCAQELLPSENIFDPENSGGFTEKLRTAVLGQLPSPQPDRLKTTPQIVNALADALEKSVRQPRREKEPLTRTAKAR